MSGISILTMFLILGFVIGGFIYFLSLAIRKESSRKKSDKGQ